MLDTDGTLEVKAQSEVVNENGIEYGKLKLEDTLQPITEKEDTSLMLVQCWAF